MTSSTSSAHAVRPDLRGAEKPRVSHVPPCSSSAGEEALELARLAGLTLDPWQELVLREWLGEREDGNWSAFEVGVLCGRQNGKNEILLARELAALFLFGERLVVHSAHEFSTSIEHFRRLLSVIEDTPDLSRRVKRISRSHGEEGAELHGGQRIRFRTRTKGGGRGFTSDLLVLDEAFELPAQMLAALLPTVSARPRPQVWYTGSAVDQWAHEHSIAFARVRERGQAGTDPRLAWFEWSVDCDSLAEVGDLADDPEIWALANPGLASESRPNTSPMSAALWTQDVRGGASLDRRLARHRRDGPAGDRPSALGGMRGRRLEARGPRLLCLRHSTGSQLGLDRVAAKRMDGKHHIEVVERRRGTRWVAERLVKLVEKHRPAAIICDGVGPAASLLCKLHEQIEVTTVSAKEHAQACGIFFDACELETLRHLGQSELDAAVKGAARRPLGDAWAWSRKNSSTDISPLVAVTLALWGVVGEVGEVAPRPYVSFA